MGYVLGIPKNAELILLWLFCLVVVELFYEHIN